MKGPGRFFLAGIAAAAALGLLAFAKAGTGDPAPKAVGSSSGLNFVDDPLSGTLTVRDGAEGVLAYHYGENLPEGIDPAYSRSCYIHPLYSLGGEVLTDDFPADHLHHHGLFWAWPVVKTRGVATGNWQPGRPSLSHHFVRWREREVRDGAVRLRAENAWRLYGGEVVAEETVQILVHPADGDGRAIDMELRIIPVGGPLELRGSPEDNKGYGGLCFRGNPSFRGAALTTDLGPLEEDSTDRRFRWADVSTPDKGVAIFVSENHPGFPTTWLVRNSYAGILNPSWPGLEGAVLTPGKPATLRYCVYVHRGDAGQGGAARAYERYAARSGPARETDR